MQPEKLLRGTTLWVLSLIFLLFWLLAVWKVYRQIVPKDSAPSSTAAASGTPEAEAGGAPSAASASGAETASEAGAKPPLLSGRVKLGRADVRNEEAQLFMVWLDAEGHELSRTALPITGDGSFAVFANQLPFIPKDLLPLRLEAQAPWHQAVAVPISIRKRPEGILAEPAVVSLWPTPIEPLLTLLFLMPALLGLPFALSHLRRRPTEILALGYALIAGSAWAVISLTLTAIFVNTERHYMPIFWPEIQVSSGLVIFAFLGTLIYAAWSVYEREPGFFTDQTTPTERDKLLRAVGGRLLVAPYVALVGWVMLSLTFPTLRGGAGSLFFGFFAGLWIRRILSFLNQLGQRLVDEEALQKLERYLEREKAEDIVSPPVRTAAHLPPPPPGYLDAVRRAREELHALDGVVGVGAGNRVSLRDGKSNEPAIVVYVEKKEELALGDPRRVPDVVHGVRTDVVVVPPYDPASPCDRIAFDLFWDKLGPAPADGVLDGHGIEWQGNILILHHEDPQSLYRNFPGPQWLFSPEHAYPLLATELNDRYDFIDFVLDDQATPLKLRSDYYVAVFNDVAGIDFYLDPAKTVRFNRSAAWGTNKLRGCQVHVASRLSLWRLLHELGHAWCSYVDIGGQLLRAGELPGKHWANLLDDGFSCMSYRQARWLDVGPGELGLQPLADDAYRFCDLDLYLMGLMPKEELLQKRASWPRRVHVDESYSKFRNLYHGQAEPIELEAAIRDLWGDRHPQTQAELLPVRYRQIFVVVTTDLASGRQLAQHLESERLRHEANVRRATDQRLELLTERLT